MEEALGSMQLWAAATTWQRFQKVDGMQRLRCLAAVSRAKEAAKDGMAETLDMMMQQRNVLQSQLTVALEKRYVLKTPQPYPRTPPGPLYLPVHAHPGCSLFSRSVLPVPGGRSATRKTFPSSSSSSSLHASTNLQGRRVNSKGRFSACANASKQLDQVTTTRWARGRLDMSLPQSGGTHNRLGQETCKQQKQCPIVPWRATSCPP